MTSTDAAAVLGLSPWRGAIDVWERMTAELAGKPYEREDLTGPDVERGIHLEKGIRDWAGQRLGRQTEPGSFSVHPKKDWLGASNDGFTLAVPKKRLLEIKCPRRDDGWGADGTDEVPDHYLAQDMVEMACHQMSSDVVLFTFGDIRIFPIERDIEAEAELIAALDDWRVRYVVAGVEPPVDASASYGRHLARRFARHNSEMREATIESRKWMAQLHEARELSKKAEAIELEARNHLCAEIGDAEGIVCPVDGWRLTWKLVKSTPYIHWEDVVSEYPIPQDVIDRHTTASNPVRRFLPKWK
jgi:putative phage-type endonuclease